MRWENVRVAGLGTWLPEPVSVQNAIDRGWCDAELRTEFGYESVVVTDTAPENAPPEMAVRAAVTALKRADVAQDRFTALFHGSTWFQGVDVWPAGSYIAERTVGSRVPAYDVQQRCNIGVSAMELAASVLRGAPPGRDAVLITTADRFCGPGVDRFRLREGAAYGDGGTALVLTTGAGFATLLSTVTTADNSLEARARGDETFRPISDAHERTVDLTARGAQFNRRHDEYEHALRIARVVYQARCEALAEAGIGIDDVRWVVVPGAGRIRGEHQLHDLIGVPEERTTWSYSRTTGHIGAGDWAAGLEHLIESGQVDAGDHILLCGGGAGFTITAAVVRIDHVPAW